MTHQPLVLQTLWRSGGTYLAFKLRQGLRALLFLEPLHEDYSCRREADWLQLAQAGMAEGLGHPALPTAHYLSDFPFEPDGVRGHEARFAWERYVLAPDEGDEALRLYLAGLADHAAQAGAQAVYKFCRGCLRTEWIERTLGARTVYLVRDPVEMAGAYQARDGGSYFYSGYLRIARFNADNPAFREVQARIDEAISPALVTPELVAGLDLAGLYEAGLKLDLFYYFWILALSAHLRPEVLIVESADFGGDNAARGALTERLANHVGTRLDFSDGRPLPRRNLPDQRRIADPVLRAAAARVWAASATEHAPARTARMAESLLA